MGYVWGALYLLISQPQAPYNEFSIFSNNANCTMNAQFLKHLLVTQISSASVSLVASIVTAVFIAVGKGPSPSRKVLYNPYRRLIFALSIADICQSFAIVTGPLMVPLDTPQALFGIGNTWTCNMNGCLFLFGMTCVPLYTLCLCIYYVCKIKSKMTDAHFANRIEKKMHFFIIVLNMGLYLPAVGMGSINSSMTGGFCTTAAYPKGCRQLPDLYGECDPFIEKVSAVYVIIGTFVVPVLSLVGIIICLGILFWNVLTMDKIFGRRVQSAREMAETKKAIYRRNLDRRRSLRMISMEEEESSESIVEDENMASFPISLTQAEKISLGIHASNNDDVPKVEGNDKKSSSPNQTYQENTNQQSRIEPDRPNNLDPEAASRLFRRELITQACCYVAVFCATTFMFSFVNILLIAGTHPNYAMAISTSILFPLGGLFNIIVYTRPNVASFLRRCPEVSRLEGFWLVLRAGGEVPEMTSSPRSRRDEMSSKFYIWKCFCRLFTRRGQQSLNVQDQDDPADMSTAPPMPIVLTNRSQRQQSSSTLSDLQYGLPAHPMTMSSIPNSAVGMDGNSLSFDSKNAAHRSRTEWGYLEGQESRVMAIQEEVDTSESAIELRREIDISLGHSVDMLSSHRASPFHSQREEKCKKDEMDEIWDTAFKRMRLYNF